VHVCGRKSKPAAEQVGDHSDLTALNFSAQTFSAASQGERRLVSRCR
jgi:hypothetical protein